MDIHPPLGRVESVKEFLTHILIVTIGILIALGLEGVRESWREHSEVKEARNSFQEELSRNLKQLNQDQTSLHLAESKIDKIIADMPELAKSPTELSKRVSELQPGFYFFSTTAWESAMSSGALTHMKRDELDRYVDAYLSVKNYQEYSRSMFPEYVGIEAYFPSHHSYTPAEEAEGEQKLRTLQMGFQVMEHLSGEMKSGIEETTKER